MDGPGVDDDQRPHPLGMPGRKRHGVVATHRVADHDHVPPAQGVHDGDQVAREVLGGVGGRSAASRSGRGRAGRARST